MSDLPDDLANCIASWPEPAHARFASLRNIIVTVAQRAQIGALIETTKWGQPSWLPAIPRISSTLRCNWHPDAPDRISLYVHCQTTLAETMRTLYPDAFIYDGNRALHMPLNAPLPCDAVDHCAYLTLTYHRKTA